MKRAVLFAGVGGLIFAAGAIAGVYVADPRSHATVAQEAIVADVVKEYCEGDPSRSPDRYLGATALGARLSVHAGVAAIVAASVARCRLM